MKLSSDNRIPFANYDIAVYFGVGIITLPFVVRITGTDALESLFSAVDFTSGLSFAYNTVILVFGLFLAYAIGHIIALLAGYLVEGFVHKWLRYPSDVWVDCISTSKDLYNTRICEGIKREHPPKRTLVALFHIPLWPWYYIIRHFKLFGFYRPKLPKELKPVVQRKLKLINPSIKIDQDSFWLKIIEHHVSNNNPAGYARLYNYLVIFGVLRSLAFLLIVASWTVIFPIIQISDVISGRSSFSLGFDPWGFLFWAICSSFATLTVMGFAKFNRRFFEEAVYAFSLERDISETRSKQRPVKSDTIPKAKAKTKSRAATTPSPPIPR